MIEVVFICDHCNEKITNNSYYVLERHPGVDSDTIVIKKRKKEEKKSKGENVKSFDICSQGCLIKLLSDILNNNQ